jgi:PAS domain S-box-containing protein
MELKPLQILLVDDDSNLLATMQDILKAKGFEPILARTGALALVQSGAADIDVALIDLYLEDMPGLELLGRLKTLTPGIECILLTGHASQGSAIEAINAGAFAYFQKPCDIDQLVLSIQRAGEKRAAGQALRANEERFRSLIENSSDIICHLNTDGTLRYISPSVDRVLGYTTADIVIGTGLLDYIHPDDLAPFLEAFSQRVQNPESKPVTMQLRVRHKDGTWRTLEGIATNFFQPSLMEGIIINAHDITARKQAEDAIRLSEKSYRDLFEDSIAGISQSLPDGRLLRVNRAYAQI